MQWQAVLSEKLQGSQKVWANEGALNFMKVPWITVHSKLLGLFETKYS